MSNNLDSERRRLRARREQDKAMLWALGWLGVGLAIAVIPQFFN